jgi:hypothetical protein
MADKRSRNDFRDPEKLRVLIGTSLASAVLAAAQNAEAVSAAARSVAAALSSGWIGRDG